MRLESLDHHPRGDRSMKFADTLLFQYLCALNLKNGSINSINKIMGFDIRKYPFIEGLKKAREIEAGER